MTDFDKYLDTIDLPRKVRRSDDTRLMRNLWRVCIFNALVIAIDFIVSLFKFITL